MPTDVAHEPTSIEDREARIEEIDARLADLDADHAGTVMPDEAREEWNALNEERDGHKTAVEELRRRRERLRSLTTNPKAGERAETGTPSLVRKRTDGIYDVTRLRAEATSEEDYRARLHDNAKRAIERASFPALGKSQDSIREHVTGLLARVDDKHGTLAKRILATGSPVYDRAFGKAVMHGTHTWTAEEQRAMSLVDGEGGFAVPFQLDPTVILTSDGALSPLRQIARVETITSKTWQGITSSGITVSRSNEAAEAADNSFTIAQPEVSPTRVIADVRFSVEVDQDWAQLRNEISRLLLDAKMVEEDTAFVTGTGVAPQPAGVVSTLDAGSEVNLAGAGAITADDLYDLEAALPVRFRSRARFLASKGLYNAVRALSTGSDGGDLWVRLASGQPSELLGYPAHEASAMDALGTASGRVLLFGDFSQFLIVDRLGMTVELNPHIVGANGRWTGQRAVVAVWRNSSLILVDNAFRVSVDPTI